MFLSNYYHYRNDMLKKILRGVFKSLNKLQQWADIGVENEGVKTKTNTRANNPITAQSEEKTRANRPKFKVVNLWDYLTFKENTQAHHIIKVVDFEEWTPMEEILRRVKELFGIQYKNDRSLYPYLKTLVDSGLLEASMNGGKMRWKKKNLLITIQEILEEEEEARLAESQSFQ
jgi:hypothetical protein